MRPAATTERVRGCRNTTQGASFGGMAAVSSSSIRETPFGGDSDYLHRLAGRMRRGGYSSPCRLGASVDAAAALRASQMTVLSGALSRRRNETVGKVEASAQACWVASAVRILGVVLACAFVRRMSHAAPSRAPNALAQMTSQPLQRLAVPRSGALPGRWQGGNGSPGDSSNLPARLQRWGVTESVVGGCLAGRRSRILVIIDWSRGAPNCSRPRLRAQASGHRSALRHSTSMDKSMRPLDCRCATHQTRIRSFGMRSPRLR